MTCSNRIVWLSLAVLAVSVPSEAQDLPPAKRAVLAEADRLSGDIARIARTLWGYSELALKENRSAALLADILEREGFRLERGVAGMPTAFVATYGSGKPLIGILAEYDALPGIGNAAVPRRQPREDGVAAGQGCGHDLFGAGSVGAAIARETGHGGTAAAGHASVVRHARGGDGRRQGLHGARRALRRSRCRARVASLAGELGRRTPPTRR